MALKPRNRQEDWYQEMIDAIGEGGGSGLPEVTSADNGKVLTVADGAWAASLNQVEISADYDPATGILTQRQGADVPTANELNTAFTCNGAVMMHVFVNDHQVGNVYLYPYGDEADGLLFGTVVRNVSADYDESINVKFSVNDDDEVAFVVYRSKTPKGRFIVELTPTSPDFSGTMDKTTLEITNAYNAGKDIEFDIPSLSVRCKGMEFAGSGGRVAVGAIVTYRANGAHMLIEILTNNGSDFDTTYQTTIYALTPAT